ncbi:MAG: CsgG/HfaB family protein [Candidatus Edwardsbacteria bacterium]|jgi:curli biogenesis system outer membrane secretion channel CsgG|nr:CsgG/HfaB family protein [Candidatus Edwardsbacteria bacterium]
MKRIITILVLATMVLAFAANAQEKTGGLKKRLAVMDFEDKTGHGGWHIGSGMADMLTTALVKSGKFMVIERQQLEKVMKEQALGQSGAVTAQSAAQVGKLLGVELMVMGSVNEFGEKESKVGGGVGGRLSGKLGGFNRVGVESKTARVGTDIRLVNTTTGEIVAAEGVAEEETKKGLDVGHDEFSFSNDAGWDQTLSGKATRKVVNKVVELVTASMAKVPWTGKIIAVNADKTVMIKPGALGGVAVGDKFTVYSAGEDVIDPETGLSLGAEETKAGTIEVIDAKDQFAKAKVVSGTGFKKLDSVREK